MNPLDSHLMLTQDSQDEASAFPENTDELFFAATVMVLSSPQRGYISYQGNYYQRVL